MKLKFLTLCLAAMPMVSFAQGSIDVSAAAPNFNDPEWQERFVGSYGFLSGAEPKVSPDEVELLQDLIELMKINPSAATERLSQDIDENSSAALLFVLANLYFQQGDLADAERYYKESTERFPDFRRAHKNLGLLYIQGQKYNEALKHLSRAVELGEQDGRNYGLMGYAYLNKEQFLSAEEAYRDAIQQQPDKRDWKLGLAQALLASEKYNEVVVLMNSMLQDEPDNATLWMLQSNAYLSMGKPELAIVNLEMVRAMGKAKRESLFLLGDIYFNQRNFDSALDAYQAAIAKDSKYDKFSTGLRSARLMLRARATPQAEALLSTLSETYSGNLSNDDELELLTVQAMVARSKGDEDQAITLLQSIVERDGARGDALLEIADYYADQDDLERSILFLQRAQKVEGFEFNALVKQAQLMVREKKYSQAAELLRDALAVKDDARVRRFLEKVESALRS
ncbi:tetratricopeptide repeat protein [Cerasicoccus maritimus]|uniref:tetratricopeptide repeat protein n=1 Tax=Cerasicoccus maritimus TaxID=490089 RepID=UPI002852A232|nr:tetratricopeptide repeat protein [Cerasicoccus maritimus]